MHGGEEYSYMTDQAEAGNRLGHWLRKTSTVEEADEAVKVSLATDTAKTIVSLQRVDHYVRFSGVRVMKDQALFEAKKEKDF